MSLPKKVQEARKKQQRERLKQKGKAGYGEYFANMPQQKLAAQENDKIVKAKADAVEAGEAMMLAEVTGEGLAAAEHDLAVANLVHAKLVQAKADRRAKPLLTAAGGAST